MATSHIAVLDLPSMNTGDKISQANRSAEGFISHPETFPAPQPSAEMLNKRAISLQRAAEAAKGGNEEQKAIYQQEEAEMDTLLRAMQRYVNQVAAGDDVIIIQAAMRPNKDRIPATKLLAPTNGIISGTKTGELSVKFDTILKSRSFNWRIFVGPNPPTNPDDYKHLEGTPTSNTIITNLPTLQIVHICCAVVGTKGQSEWSAPVSRGVL